jgi:uncharacterized protein DUF4942
MTDLKDFYPTPPELIERLIEGLRPCNGPFLEPSGGKGDIADYLSKRLGYYDNYTRKRVDIDVIEINQELQHIIKGKGFRLIHDDFLTFETRKAYGTIVANFPFSEGDKHLEKSLDLLTTHGGQLRCLVNAETLKNPYTNLRKALLARLDELAADIEYIGGAFEDADRPTSVEVALIKVCIERPAPFSILLESLKQSQQPHATAAATQEIIGADFVSGIVAHFGMECDAGVRLIKEYQAMKPYILDQLIKEDEGHYASPLITLRIQDRDVSGLDETINRYVRGTRKKYWAALVRDPRFSSQYTSNILSELDKKLEELKDYDFSAFNIRELQKELSAKVVQGVEDAILSLFDTCSRVHAYGEDFGNNIHYYNGWKTNKAHKINKKIILPMYGLRADIRLYGAQLDYRFADKLNDMVKVFNYLSRDKVDVPKLVGDVLAEATKNHDFDLDCRYFRMKLFKKGTAHIWFKDLDLLDKFNIFGSQRKNWLPPSYGKKRYAEMSEEERQVVDEFQGRDKYEQVMNDPSFYLVDARSLLLAA